MSSTKKVHDPLITTFDPLLHTNTDRKVDLFDDNSIDNDTLISTTTSNQPVLTSASKLAASLLSSNIVKQTNIFKEETNIFGDDDDILFKQIKKNREEHDSNIRKKEQEYAEKEKLFKAPNRASPEPITQNKNTIAPPKSTPLPLTRPTDPSKIINSPKAADRPTENINPVVVEKPVEVTVAVEEEITNFFGDHDIVTLSNDDIFTSQPNKSATKAIKPAFTTNPNVSSKQSNADERGVEGLFVPSGAVEFNSNKKVAQRDADMFDVGTEEEFLKFEKNLKVNNTNDTIVKKIGAKKDEEDDLLKMIENTAIDTDINIDENFDLDAYMKEQSSSNNLFD